MLVRLKARAWTIAVAGCATALMIGGGAVSSSAQVIGTPNLIGQWTVPFEEGGTATPRCVPAQGDTAGILTPDGKFF